jgi:glucoamylase
MSSKSPMAPSPKTPSSTARRFSAACSWQSQLEKWMVTTNGPFSPLPYYLRLTKDGMPNVGTTYGLGDGGPSVIDQRKVADAGFLELVRLGIKPAYDVVIVNSLQVVDAQIASISKPSSLKPLPGAACKKYRGQRAFGPDGAHNSSAKG